MRVVGPLLLMLLTCAALPAAEKTSPFKQLGRQYKKDVLPVLRRYCLTCHSSKRRQGELDLQRFAQLSDVRRVPRVWVQVAEMLDNGEMPPQKSPQLAAQQRRVLREWVRRYLRAESLASAGDPGPVVLRRLNNAEYTYTIQDLTGVPLEPAKGFPTAGAAGEGFTNVGNALVMSPGLLRKYLDAGKDIAAHAVLLPAGFRFSKHKSARDWTDEIIAEIRGFYAPFTREERLGSVHGHPRLTSLGKTGRIPLTRYLTATLVHRGALAKGTTTLAQVARQQGLNERYLTKLWNALHRPKAAATSFLLSELRRRWQKAKPKEVKSLVTHIRQWQDALWTINPVGLIGRRGSPKSWLEKMEPVLTTHKMQLSIPAAKKGQKAKPYQVSFVAGDANDGNEQDFVLWQKPRLTRKGKPDVLLRDVLSNADRQSCDFGQHPLGGKYKIDTASICARAPDVITVMVPAKFAGTTLQVTARMHSGSARQGSAQVALVAGKVEPPQGLLLTSTKVVLGKVNIGADERQVVYSYPFLTAAKGPAASRLQQALADHRDLFPAALCYMQIVPADEFLTVQVLHRSDEQLQRLMLNAQQKQQIDRLWKELRFVSREPLRLAAVLDSMLETTIDHPQEGVFADMVKPVRKRAAEFRRQLQASQVHHLNQLMGFAQRSWRRPLVAKEKQSLRGLYQKLRQHGLSHDRAFRLTFARVLTAAPFLYKLEAAAPTAQPALVSQFELANRLSYFLWSSSPDAKLTAAAQQGKLHQTSVLLAHTRRLLKGQRVKRLAIEFGCQWLHIHDFPLEKKSRKHYPQFEHLKGDMYEESIRFLTDLFRNNRSLLDVLAADYTFVNDRLAKHYGIPIQGKSWRRVQGIKKFGRGGILTHATFLAKQSGTTRTSPILRGNWISEVLLGEKLPKPPRNVPQLADDVPSGLTERQLIERHSSDPACAKCHRRIDPFGFALETYDAIGRRRSKSGGILIDTRTKLPDGTKVAGPLDLNSYLLTKRRDAFVLQFCRKLLGYALGRQLQLSDQPLVEEMHANLKKHGFRLNVAVESIVLSKQFRMIRGRSP